MKQAVVFFDVDGTLISGKTNIVPDSTVEAIKRLRANGHIPVINTGRPFGHLQPPVKALDIRDYVCACGMYIKRDGAVIQDYRPTKELCLQMRDLVISCKMDAFFESMNTVFYIHNFFKGFEWECEILRKASVELRADVMADDFYFDKFVVWNRPESDFATFCYEVSKYFTIIFRSPRFTELVPIGFSKGIGMKNFIASLGEGERTVYAFGDSNNDVEMFRNCDVSVLMGDGKPTLRDQVDYVTDAVDDDGIMHALEHFGLI